MLRILLVGSDADRSVGKGHTPIPTTTGISLPLQVTPTIRYHEEEHDQSIEDTEEIRTPSKAQAGDQQTIPIRTSRQNVGAEQLNRTIPEIAKAIDRVGKGDDPYHSLRVALTKMHKGHKNSKGDVVKLPHRMSRAAVAACAKAGNRVSK